MDDDLGRLMKIAHSFRYLKIDCLFDEMSKGEFATLKAIERMVGNDNKEGVTVGKVSEQIKCSSPALSKMLRILEDKEMIIRTVNKKDRRNTNIFITDKGNDILGAVDKKLHTFSDEVARTMGQNKIEQMADLMEEMYSTSEQILERMEAK